MRRRILLLAALGVLTAPAATCAASSIQPWSSPGHAAVSADGRFIYATGSPTLTFARDPASGALALVDTVAPAATMIALSPDGRFAYLAGADIIHTLVRDVNTGLLTDLETIASGDSDGFPLSDLDAIAISPDGRTLYAVAPRSAAIVAFDRDTVSGHLTYLQTTIDDRLLNARDIAITPNGRFVHIAGGAGIETLVRGPDGRLSLLPAMVVTGGSGAIAIAEDPAGGRLYGSLSYISAYSYDASGALTFLPDQAQGDLLDWAQHEVIAVSPDGRLLANQRNGGRALALSRRTANGAASVQTVADGGAIQIGIISGLAWSPDSRVLYESGEPGQITTLVRTPDDHVIAVATLAPAIPTLPTAPTPTVSIDGGALYTNDVDATITVACDGGTSFLLSNDAGFAGARLTRVRLDATYPWTLNTAGPSRDVRRVYIRCARTTSRQPTTYFDDIVLDRIDPVVVSATLALAGAGASNAASHGARLILRARDNRSHVRALELAASKRHPSHSRRYVTHLRVNAPAHARWVRVRDGAGNWSRWHRVRRKL